MASDSIEINLGIIMRLKTSKKIKENNVISQVALAKKQKKQHL
jgi:hypothetical protein